MNPWLAWPIAALALLGAWVAADEVKYQLARRRFEAPRHGFEPVPWAKNYCGHLEYPQADRCGKPRRSHVQP